MFDSCSVASSALSHSVNLNYSLSFAKLHCRLSDLRDRFDVSSSIVIVTSALCITFSISTTVRLILKTFCHSAVSFFLDQNASLIRHWELTLCITQSQCAKSITQCFVAFISLVLLFNTYPARVVDLTRAAVGRLGGGADSPPA